MTLKIYNTLSKQVEEFKPIEEGKVKLYTCGPTVYGRIHIGNLRSFTVFDLVSRYLRYKGYEVEHVFNITDVDDKTIRDSQKEGKSLKEFTQGHADTFLNDLKEHNFLEAEHYPYATDYINEMVDFIKVLLEKEIAYKADDGIYYSVQKAKDYGKLSGVKLDQLQAGASGRLDDEYDKDQVADFALWKFYQESDGPVFWETNIGKGRPGWHIECSVMANKILGKTFDIHMGGEDLKFPHHENEIAQSEAHNDAQFVNYWMHVVHLMVDGKKMSKSLGNFYTPQDLHEKGCDPMAVRYAMMTVHYQVKMNFTFEVVEAAKNALETFRVFILAQKEKSGEENAAVKELIESTKTKFEEAMDNNFEISQAMAALFEFMTEANKLDYSKENAQEILTFLKDINQVLGFLNFDEDEIPTDIEQLAKERDEARESKDWAKSDELRDQIQAKGFIVEDTPAGTRVRTK